MSESEQWKPIAGYEGLYEVSNLGRVKRITEQKNKKPINRVLKVFHSKNPGYGEVGLCKNGKSKNTRVHLLVAAAFLEPKPFPEAEVNHKNGVKRENAASNLEWKTSAGNLAHAVEAGLRSTVRPKGRARAQLDPEKVRYIKAMEGKMTQVALARMFDVSPGTIDAVRKGRTWQHVT